MQVVKYTFRQHGVARRQLVALALDYYNEGDYIRDYQEFVQYVQERKEES